MTVTSRLRNIEAVLRDHRGTILFLLLMLCFRSAWADWVTVPTGSMNPTILEGDRLLVDKHVFGLRVPFTLVRLTQGEDPRRGDIIVFDSPVDGISLVKRVVAVPGDVVELQEGVLIINGQRSEYSMTDQAQIETLLQSTRAMRPVIFRETGVAGEHNIMMLPHRPFRGSLEPVLVPPDHYFVLGDNRDNSADSRYIGFVPRRNIVGRATRVVLSLNPENYYLPRGERFLVQLN